MCILFLLVRENYTLDIHMVPHLEEHRQYHLRSEDPNLMLLGYT